jgi:hypothetical protein
MPHPAQSVQINEPVVRAERRFDDVDELWKMLTAKLNAPAV